LLCCFSTASALLRFLGGIAYAVIIIGIVLALLYIFKVIGEAEEGVSNAVDPSRPILFDDSFRPE
jgi:hypothetical protein